MYILYKHIHKRNYSYTNNVHQAITTLLYINLYLYTSVIFILVQSSPVQIPSPFINKPIAVISMLQTFYLHQTWTLPMEYKTAAQMGLLSTAGL